LRKETEDVSLKMPSF